MRPATLKVQTSSGGVIFRRKDDCIEIVMVTVKEGQVWCLPKGVIDKGELPEDTAIREVREEAGVRGNIIEKLGEITYWYYIKEEHAKCKKTVHFFLMEYAEGNIKDHDQEVNDAFWIPLDEAIKKAQYKGEREMLEKARTMFSSGQIA